MTGFLATACSVDSVENGSEFGTLDAKGKMITTTETTTFLRPESATVCEGDVPTFTFEFPQNEKGNGETQVQLQFEVSPGEWVQIKKEKYTDAGPKEYIYDYDYILEAGESYNFRAQIGSGGFDYVSTITVVECEDCEESFTYDDNEDGSYTFTYVPAEDMTGANVTFTFPQGFVDVSPAPFTQNGNGNDTTFSSTMDLTSCEEYSWTFELSTHCRGKGQAAVNLWTDFKVNETSKKGDLENITQSCN